MVSQERATVKRAAATEDLTEHVAIPAKKKQQATKATTAKEGC
jgi:hypothetical protein